MCGIVGYNGNRLVVPILVQSLKKLEYRGYDSAGLAVFNEKKKIEIKKSSGRISALEEKVKEIKYGNCGIGHTRWATHGEPTEVNAHPHFSDDKSVAVVHNGIIENFSELKTKLEKNGYKFYSQTDTEVLTKLIHYYWKKYGKKAGYIRNREMHEFISHFKKRGVVAFWDGKSKGTAHSFELAKEFNNDIKVVRFWRPI